MSIITRGLGSRLLVTRGYGFSVGWLYTIILSAKARIRAVFNTRNRIETGIEVK